MNKPAPLPCSVARMASVTLVLSAMFCTAVRGEEPPARPQAAAEVSPLPPGLAPQDNKSRVGKTLVGEPPWLLRRDAAKKGLLASRIGKSSAGKTTLSKPAAEKKVTPAMQAEDRLQAVAAKLWADGQADEAAAIEEAAGSLTGKLQTKAKPARTAPAARRVSAEITEARYLMHLESLNKAVSSGLGRKHPKVMALTETIRREWKALKESENETDAGGIPKVRRAEAATGAGGTGNHPVWGVAVPGKSGLVYSPYTPERSVVDVTGFKKGSKVKCPYTGNFFQVP